MEKPTYEDLLKKIKYLEQNESLIHNTLSQYLQDLNKNVLGLLIGTRAPFKLEKYFGHPNETIDWENPNLEHYKNNNIRVIGSVDSE